MFSEPVLVVANSRSSSTPSGSATVVGGSVASPLYGIPRATQDVDLGADVRLPHVDAITSALTGEFSSVFFAATRKPNGAVSYLDLFEAHSIRITRHAKVRSEATAFDPEHQDYFRLRRVVQKRADERGLLGF